ncbi:MAG: molybdenum cofactor guanylyltransferase, partial [Rhodocyclaceae bacterium]|nr:molybdenum cofactor guanylyltransferase [Rhodocyclaceae bacterium]
MGRRMGGADKGLMDYAGRPLVAAAIERLSPQVDALLVNANRNAAAYAAYGHPVVADAVGGYAGPLAGLQAGLAACATPLLATVPCDSPRLPADLVARLRAGLEGRADGELAVAAAGGRWQPVFLLCRRAVLPGLEEYLAAGGRRIEDWVRARRHAVVEFPDPAAFANINTP